MRKLISYVKVIKWRVVFVFTVFQFIVTSSFAQQRMALSECINQALQANYSIKISRNQVLMAKNDVDYSYFLPSLTADAKQNQTRNDVKTENSAGEISELSDVKTNNYSAGVALNWRLFDGLEMFTTHERYKELEAKGELSVKMAVENLILEVSAAYYDVLVQQHRLKTARHSLDLSKERYEDAYTRKQLYKISGLELAQVKVDLNSDSSFFAQQKEILKSAYINLNKLMNIDLQRVGYVQDTIVLGLPLQLKELERNTLLRNTTLLIAKREQRISALDLKNAKALFFPTLDFNSGYNFNKTNSPASNTKLNRTNGFYWGFSVNVPIFSRMQNRTMIRNARLEQENSEFSYKEAEVETLANLALLYNTYENNLLMVGFEQESAKVASDNLDAAMEKNKLGSLSGLEFREFQRSYLDAVDRMLSAIYQAKVSELSLLLVSGDI